MAEGMKDSGIEWVGEIPEEWRMGRIAHRYSLTLGKMVESETEDSNKELLPYLCAANLKWGGVDTSVQKEMWFSKAEQSELELREGDVLITEGGSVGTACIYHGEMGRCFFQNSVIRARGEDTVANEFLAYWLETVCSSGYLDTVCNKATISHYTKDKVSKTPMPSVPRSAVVAIVAALNEQCGKLSSALKTLEEQVDVLERYRKSLIHEAVTKGLCRSVPMRPSGIDWIGDIPEGWAVKKLKHLSKSFESGTSVRAAANPAEPNEKGVLSLSAVFGGFFNPSANKTVDGDELSRVSCPVKGGSLLVSRCNTSEWVGLPAYVDKDYPNLYLPDKLWQIDCGSTELNRFIWYALQSKSAREYCAVMSVGSSNSMQNIASSDLLNMYIALPATQEERNTIVAYLDEKCARIDSLLAAKCEQIDILKKRRQSLIYEYVTGKRRVSKEA